MFYLSPGGQCFGDSVVTVEEASGVVLVLQIGQFHVSPLVVAVNCAQRLIAMGVVLVLYQLVESREPLLGPLVAPLDAECLDTGCVFIIRVHHDKLDHVVELSAMRECGEVIGELVHGLVREGLDHQHAATGGGVSADHLHKVISEIVDELSIELPGDDAAHIVVDALRAGEVDEAINGGVECAWPRGLNLFKPSGVGLELAYVLLGILGRSNILDIENNFKLQFWSAFSSWSNFLVTDLL